MINQENEISYLSSPLSKEDMIHDLIDDDYKNIINNPETMYSWIWDTLQYGNIGYQNLKNEELKKVYEYMKGSKNDN